MFCDVCIERLLVLCGVLHVMCLVCVEMCVYEWQMLYCDVLIVLVVVWGVSYNVCCV